jgi:hypothetical protein
LSSAAIIHGFKWRMGRPSSILRVRSLGIQSRKLFVPTNLSNLIGITGHNSAREKTAGQVRSYRLHAPSPPLQRSHRALLYAGPKQCARFGARGSAARASHRIAAATLPDQETRADRAPVFIRRCSFRPSSFFLGHNIRSLPSQRVRDAPNSTRSESFAHAPTAAARRAASLRSSRKFCPPPPPPHPRSRTCSSSNHCSISFAPPSAAHKACRGQRARACACACACACA